MCSSTEVTNKNQAKIDLIPGAGTSNFALRVYDRTRRYYGLIHRSDHRCLQAGQFWEINAKFKLLNTTGHGAMCDPSYYYIYDDKNCPHFSLEGRRCTDEDGGTTSSYARLWNDIFDVDWNPDEFNTYRKEFPINNEFASCKEVYFSIKDVNSDWDIVIDDVSVTLKTDPPTAAPTLEPTRIPTLDPTFAPTSDGTIEPTSSPTNLPTKIARDCPEPGGELQLLNIGVQFLSIAQKGHLCTITKATLDTNGDVDSIAPIARSYDGHAWSNAAGTIAAVLLAEKQWKCYTKACEIDLPPLELSNEKYILTSYNHTLQPLDEVARFLESTTFGTLKNDLNNWDFNSAMNITMSAWVRNQMDTNMTSHREYWRNRSNPRFIQPR